MVWELVLKNVGGFFVDSLFCLLEGCVCVSKISSVKSECGSVAEPE